MEEKRRNLRKKILKGVGIFFLFFLTFVVLLAGALYLAMKDICTTAVSTRNTFITTLLETGQLKFLASVCLSDAEIQEVIDANSMKSVTAEEINESLIVIGGKVEDKNNTGKSSAISSTDVEHGNKQGEEKPIEIVEIPGLTFKATMMIVKDPSRVSLATICGADGKWPNDGQTLEWLVQKSGALGAINGGLYHSTNNSGGWPYGLCVSNGEILRNKPWEYGGLVFIGLTDKNILQIIDISDMSAADCAKMVKERGIRDGVCFQEELSVDSNHFVYLVTNGEPRQVKGAGSGLNPRTAIGQRADGALLLLVTDGRGYNNHVGASAADLIDIMTRYGAVNAANLDGGSSTCMYYDGKYLQNSVTFYYSQSSWKLPCAFVIH